MRFLFASQGFGTPNFTIDFTVSGTSYTGATPSRTGSNPLYVIQSSSTVAAVASLSDAIYEDRGDGYGGGVWSFPALTNLIANPNDLAGGGWSSTGGTIASNTAQSPNIATDVTADTFTDASAAAAFAVYQVIGSANSYNSCWAKQASPTPSAPGMLSTLTTAAAGVSWGTPTVWTRTVSRATANIFALWGPGQQPGPVTTAAATGAYFFWGQCRYNLPGDLPVVAGTSGAAVIAIDATQVVSGGDLDVEVSFNPGYDSTLDATDWTLWSATSTDGLMSLRYVSASDTYVLKVRGSDVLTVPAAGSGSNANQSWRVNDYFTVRSWYRVSTGACGVQITISGVTSQPTTSTTTGTALAAPTVAHVASLSGTSAYFPARVRKWTTHQKSDIPANLSPEILILGDSTVASYVKYIPSDADVYTVAQRETRAGISSLAVPGDTIAGQQAKFNASYLSSASSIKAVIVEVGLNDCTNVAVSATVIAAYQTLVNTIAAALPTAKILLHTMTPAKQRYIDLYGGPGGAAAQAVYTALNAAIMGGASAITGAYSHTNTAQTSLDDGAGNLAAAYDIGDHIHPNNAGRSLISAAHKASLQAASVLP